jgi:hypothetical protein
VKSWWQHALSTVVGRSPRMSRIEYDVLAERNWKELWHSFGSSTSFSHTNLVLYAKPPKNEIGEQKVNTAVCGKQHINSHSQFCYISIGHVCRGNLRSILGWYGNTVGYLISYMGEGCQHLCWLCWVVCRWRNTGTLCLARFEVLMAVTMKITVFWDVTLCSVVDYYHHFRATCCIDLHPWRWRQQVPRPNWTSWMRIRIFYVFLLKWPKCCRPHLQLETSFLIRLSNIKFQDIVTKSAIGVIMLKMQVRETQKDCITQSQQLQYHWEHEIKELDSM